MVDSALREAKELYKEKESETTWFKIFGVFDQLSKAVRSKDAVVRVMPPISDLLIRSLQSDRSRLNGIAVDFLKNCVDTAQRGYNFSTFVPVLLRLTGKSNKIFVTRATEALVAVCRYVDLKCLLKNVHDFVDNANKNVRFAVFKIVEIRIDDAREVLTPIAEKGLRDPAQEVRTLCKGIKISPAPAPVVEKEIKKNILVSVTPRKSCKVDTAYAEIKKLEDVVTRLTKEQVVSKPISSDFFKKLSELKKDRKQVPETKEYDLTPRRLDRYLNKYRATSPVPLPRSLMKDRALQADAKSDVVENTPLDETSPFSEPFELGPIHAESEMIECSSQGARTTSYTPSKGLGYSLLQDVGSLLDIGMPSSAPTVPQVMLLPCVSKPLPPSNDATVDQVIQSLMSEMNPSSAGAGPAAQSELGVNVSFMNETEQFKREICNSVQDDGSIVHKVMDASIHLEVPHSDPPVQTATCEAPPVCDLEAVVDYYQLSDMNCEDQPWIDDPIEDCDNSLSLNPSFGDPLPVSELSHSFANLSIEPSMQGKELQPEVVRSSTLIVESNNLLFAENYRDSLDLIREYNSTPEEKIDPEKETSNPEDGEGRSSEVVRSDLAEMPLVSPLKLSFDYHGLDNSLSAVKISRPDDPQIILGEESSEESLGMECFPLGCNESVGSFIGKLERADEGGVRNVNVNETVCVGNVNVNETVCVGNVNDTVCLPNVNDTVYLANDTLHIANDTLCMVNLNDTIVIDPSLRKDRDPEFHSCVDLFNEPIFGSDEEDACAKRGNTLKERPSFSIEIPIEPHAKDDLNEDGQP